MDIKKQNFYADLRFTGNSESITFEGSISAIILELTKQLIHATVRKNAQGNKVIKLHISDSKSHNPDEIDAESRVKMIEEHIIESSDAVVEPMESETAQQFHDRLVNEGESNSTALFVTQVYFPQFGEKDLEEIKAWLGDEKAIRFRQLNHNQMAMDNSSPEEFKFLLAYCTKQFPEFVARMTIRVLGS